MQWNVVGKIKLQYFSELLVEIELATYIRISWMFNTIFRYQWFSIEESIIIFLNHISNKVLFRKKRITFHKISSIVYTIIYITYIFSLYFINILILFFSSYGSLYSTNVIQINCINLRNVKFNKKISHEKYQFFLSLWLSI